MKNVNISTEPSCSQSGIDVLNEMEGSLTGYDCKKCRNKGGIYYEKDGCEYFRVCECMKIRESLRRIERSGLGRLLGRYTFRDYLTTEPFQRSIKTGAQDFLTDCEENWFFIGGQVGCGKTHICTAIVGELLNQGREAQYMNWRDEVTRIKANANTADYCKLLKPFKTAEVLYIDDLFKTERTKNPTTADINIAFELFNYRYINRGLITVISSEKTINELIDVDEAVGSRIHEMSVKYCFSISPDRSKNYRLKSV